MHVTKAKNLGTGGTGEDYLLRVKGAVVEDASKPIDWDSK